MRALPIVASVALVLGAVITFLPQEAEASIKNPNDHPDYRAELEPHIAAVFWRYRYAGYYGGRGRRFRYFGDPEFGPGFRATIEIADPAFIPKINNTVGISFGLDTTFGCHSYGYCREDFWIWNPITLQWNFFFDEHWSAFADIGFILRGDGFYRHVYPDLAFMIGGRYHFNDTVALTARIGIPFFTFGVSFFVGS